MQAAIWQGREVSLEQDKENQFGVWSLAFGVVGIKKFSGGLLLRSEQGVQECDATKLKKDLLPVP